MSNAQQRIGDTLFPIGIATGAAFCNRDEERAALSDNVLAGTHTWIMGIRHGHLASPIGEFILCDS